MSIIWAGISGNKKCVLNNSLFTKKFVDAIIAISRSKTRSGYLERRNMFNRFVAYYTVWHELWICIRTYILLHYKDILLDLHNALRFRQYDVDKLAQIINSQLVPTLWIFGTMWFQTILKKGTIISDNKSLRKVTQADLCYIINCNANKECIRLMLVQPNKDKLIH